MAALCGSMAGALAAMVANLTVPTLPEGERQKTSDLAVRAQEVKDQLLVAIDDDTLAFDQIIQARRRPRKTDEEKEAREDAILEANQGATLVPLRVLELSVQAIELAAEMVAGGLPTAVSDCGTGTRVGLAAAEGAYLNVRINLVGIREQAAAWCDDVRRQADAHLARARELAESTWPRILDRIEG